MKKCFPLLALAAALLAGPDAGAQRTCASHGHLQHQITRHPEMALQRQRLEKLTQDFLLQPGTGGKGTAVVFNIPVVVHVLYNNSTQNISDAQIQSQIDVLNQDFQLLNADAANVPAAFSALKADCQISFCLAQRDPSGAVTNGITRKSTTRTNFNADLDEAKYTATGGEEAWPTDQYLNIWVVPSIYSSGVYGILGYAQFPGGPAPTDGVVIGYNYFGTTGTAAAPFNKGRTTTHEVGHWLNLNHIWGDDGGMCTGDDLVGDTPNQGSENYGCPSFPHITCSNGPDGDMYMNFMDYTDDACMAMFSAGQKSRMHALFEAMGPRVSLLTSLGCTPPGPNCTAPIGLAASGVTSGTATLSWAAVTGATAYNLQWKAVSAASWNTVSGLSGTAYSLSGLASATAYHFRVQSLCGASAVSDTGAPASFTTLTACTNSYEPNETITAATAIPLNTPVFSRIATGTDKDHFKFNNSMAAPKIKISLTSLPANYELKLLKSNGTTLLTSAKTGTTAESIIYNTTTVGTYYVMVYPKDKNSFNANLCYNLLVQTSIASFRGEQNEDDHDDHGEDNRLAGPGKLRLYPNPAKGMVYYELPSASAQTAYLTVMDQSGRQVMALPLSLQPGTNRSGVDISTLSAGLYFIKLVSTESTLSTKLVVE